MSGEVSVAILLLSYMYMHICKLCICVIYANTQKTVKNKLSFKTQVRKSFHFSYPGTLYNPLLGLYIVTTPS